MSQKLNKRSSEGIAAIFIVIIVVAIVAVVFFVFKDYIKFNFRGTATPKITEVYDPKTIVDAVKEASNSNSSGKLEYATHYQQPYSFKYPLTWRIKENPGSGFDLLVSNGQSGKDFGAIYLFQSSMSLEDQLQHEKNSLGQAFSGVKINPERRITIDGNPAYEITFNFEDNGFASKGVVIVTNKSFRSYGLTFYGVTEIYNKHYSTISTSFKVI